MNNIEVWLWILLVMLPHNSRTAELLKRYGSALEAARAMRDGRCDLLSEQEKKRAERTRNRDVKAIISECEQHGIRMLTLDDEEYPPLLRRIPDPPIVLFVKGTLAALREVPSVAAVGPRSPSEYGRKVTTALCGELARNGVAIISGLAVGIDAAAHRAAIDCGGMTTGVLGCGILVNYPAENEELKNSIIENGGAIISELLPHTTVSSSYFRYRNRIISGMAMGTLVTEAASRSGALLTAARTFEQGRPLFVIPPHDIFADRFSGVFPLIRRGATVVSGAYDIAEVLYDTFREEPEFSDRLTQLKNALTPAVSQRTKPKSTAKSAVIPENKPQPTAETSDETPKNSAPAKMPDTSSMSEENAKIVNALYPKPLTMDELLENTGLSYREACDLLLDLELDEIVIRNQDATYSLL